MLTDLCLSHTTSLPIIDYFIRYKYSNFTLRVTQFNFTLSDENRKYSHMIEYQVILRAVFWLTWKQCTKHVVSASGSGTEGGRNPCRTIGRLEKIKERIMISFTSSVRLHIYVPSHIYNWNIVECDVRQPHNSTDNHSQVLRARRMHLEHVEVICVRL